MTQRRLALAGLSARWLAESAQRCGYRAIALDLFGDVDTRRASDAWYRIGEPAALRIDTDRLFDLLESLYRAGRIDGWIPAAGFDGVAQAWSSAAPRPPLIGNTANAVAAVRDPAVIFALLDRLGIAHPEVALARPDASAGWLRKDADGSGGMHIRRLEDAGTSQSRSAYYQRACPGRSLSALFVADRRRAHVIAFSEQLIEPHGPSPYVFCGALGPVDLPPRTAAQIRRALDALVAATGLAGLNSLDFLCDGERFDVLEINPRPSATLALYDTGLLRAHVAACAGEALDQAPRFASPGLVRGTRVVFAAAPCVIGAAASERLATAGWVHDIPSPNTRVGRGEPLCSVSAAGADAAAVRARLAHRARQVLSMMESFSNVDSCTAS